MTYVTLHDVIPTTIEAKRDLYKKVTVQAYVRGLKEPLGSRIRCMRPNTIEKALEYVQEELNVIYLHQRNEPSKNNSTPKVTTPHNNSPSAAPQFMPPRPFNFQTNLPNWPVPFGQRPMRPPTQPFHYNQPRMPTNTQRMFAAPPPNYNPRSNLFRLQPRNNQTNGQTAQPMSGIQRFNTRQLPPTGHDWTRFGNPPPSNYFKTREMHVNECTPYDISNYDDGYNYGEPEYNYLYDNEYYAHDPGLPYDYYNATVDDGPYESHPQALSNPDEQDFREDSSSSKPK